ncbi:MAG: hypothetical protein KBC43_08025 [Bacteroidales bacterium]|nr:hypothetical protein [Bacteroidales bacterium]
MELYTSITEWLKKNPSEDKNEKILTMINKKNRTQLKRELAKKQKALETLINEITDLENQVGQLEVKSR